MQLDLLSYKPPEPKGSTYVPERDKKRLTAQAHGCLRVWSDGKKRTLAEMRELTGYPEASISARFRDLRAAGYPMKKDPLQRGLYVYWMQIEHRAAA